MNNNKLHSVGKYLLNIYVGILFFVMPPFIKSYNYLASEKWLFYSYFSFGFSFNKIFIPGFLLLIGLCLIIEIIFFKYRLEFDVYDLFILLFGLVIYISGKVSESSYFISSNTQIMIGYPSWYMGEAAQLSFILIYFFVKQYFECNKRFFDYVLAVSSIIFFLAILNRFNIDIFGFWDSVMYDIKQQTVSTLGNIDWYTCYLVLHLPISAYCFLYAKSKREYIFYGAAFSLGILTLVSNGADSGFFVLIFMMYLLFKKEDKKVIYLVLIGSLSCCTLGIFQRVFADVAYIPSTLCKISTLSILPWIIVVFSVFLLKNDKLYETFKKIVVIGFPILVVIVVVYIVLNSFNLLPDFLSIKQSYLYFNDSWGNNRGVIWRMGISAFINYVKKYFYILFIGCGPDQYYNMVYKYQYHELVELRQGVFASCAHNEFINTLCNYGILGFIFFYGFWAMLLKKKGNNGKYDRMLKLMIISYLINSIVSIQTIITAPLLFACAGMLDCKENDNKFWLS